MPYKLQFQIQVLSVSQKNRTTGNNFEFLQSWSSEWTYKTKKKKERNVKNISSASSLYNVSLSFEFTSRGYDRRGESRHWSDQIPPPFVAPHLRKNRRNDIVDVRVCRAYTAGFLIFPSAAPFYRPDVPLLYNEPINISM